MGRVEAFDSPKSVVCRFHSNDHLPPHFHVRTQDGRLHFRVAFLEPVNRMVTVIVGEPRAKLIHEITALAAANRVSLLKEWEEKVSHEN